MLNAPWHISKYGSLVDCNGVAFANPTSTASEGCKKKLQLAVAAPELLAALQEIADAYDSVSLNPTARVLSAKARAAIAKAKGQQ